MAKGPTAVDFFDEDDAHEPPRRAVSSRRGRVAAARGGLPRRPALPQQIRTRQLAFLLGAIVVLILMVIAFRGCLDARKERATRTTSATSARSPPTPSRSARLLRPARQGPRRRAATSASRRGQRRQRHRAGRCSTAPRASTRPASSTAPSSRSSSPTSCATTRSRGSPPSCRQRARRQGGAEKADQAIYTQMRCSLGQRHPLRARPGPDRAGARRPGGHGRGRASRQPVPADGKSPNYLDPERPRLRARRRRVRRPASSDAACKDDGRTHGLGLVDVSSLILRSGSARHRRTVTASGDDEIEVAVQNQGDADESEHRRQRHRGRWLGRHRLRHDRLDRAGETETVDHPAPSGAGRRGQLRDRRRGRQVGCEQVADEQQGAVHGHVL